MLKCRKTMKDDTVNKRKRFSVICCSLMLGIFMIVAVPKQAAACEASAQLSATQSIMASLQDAAFNALNSVVQQFITNALGPFGSFLTSSIDTADDDARTDYSELWEKWLDDGLKPMAEQLNVSLIDRSRQQGSMLDSQVQSMSQRAIERRELEAFRDLTPSDQMCVVDTVNPYLLKP